MGEIKIMSINVRGLRNFWKRRAVYEFLTVCDFDICMVQEAHLRDEGDVLLFTEEWGGGEAVWSVGSVYGSGVGVLCGRKSIKIIDTFSVIQGRVLVVDIKKAGLQCRVVNIYAHAEPRAHRELFAGLDICFMTSKVTFVGGDLNCSLDKDGGSPLLRDFMTKYRLVDAMGKILGKRVGHTWENSRGMKSRLDYILVGDKEKVTGGGTIFAPFTDHKAIWATVRFGEATFGKAYWKLNNDILTEHEYRERFRRIFGNGVDLKDLYENRGGGGKKQKRK